MRTIAKVCYYAVLLAALGGAKAVRETPWRRLDEPAQPPPAPVACGAPAICATLWERRDEAAVGTWPRRTAPDQRRAIGSAGERLVHTEEVTGSIPVSPTRSAPMLMPRCVDDRPFGSRGHPALPAAPALRSVPQSFDRYPSLPVRRGAASTDPRPGLYGYRRQVLAGLSSCGVCGRG